jgi:branched-chain amino acid transport system ATP-binding protein
VLKTLFGMLGAALRRSALRGQALNGKTQRELPRRRHRVRAARAATCSGSLSVRHNLELGGITLPRGELPGRIEEALGRFPRIKERIDNQASTMSAASRSSSRSRVRCLLRPARAS